MVETRSLLEGETNMNNCDIAYLLGALADGGCYCLKYRDGRSEYRCVWTQASPVWLLISVKPRLENILENLGSNSKVKMLKGNTRYEIRVSSKLVFQLLTQSKAKIPKLIEKCENEILRHWLRGLYDAEGDKSGKRLRLWNKDRTILTLAVQALKCFGIEAYGPYLDDKRHGVHVIEIPSKHRRKFRDEIGFEHPKLA